MACNKMIAQSENVFTSLTMYTEVEEEGRKWQDRGEEARKRERKITPRYGNGHLVVVCFKWNFLLL